MTSLDFFTNAQGLTAWLWAHDAARDDLAARHAEHRAQIQASGERISAALARWSNREDNTDV